jgi:hypothetical protein
MLLPRLGRVVVAVLVFAMLHAAVGQADITREARALAPLTFGAPGARSTAPPGKHHTAPRPDSILVRRARFGSPVPAGFMGFSFEYDYLLSYTGTNPHAINPVLVRLIHNLVPRGRVVLRIGGNSTDRTWWPIPGLAPPPGVSYSLSPGWLATLRALADATHAHLILGINLNADSTTIAVAEAQALLAGLGPTRIDSLEIGNEPELYPNQWYEAVPGAQPQDSKFEVYLNAFSRIASALPPSPLAGLATEAGNRSWLGGLPQLFATAPAVRRVTVHQYPLNNCNSNANSPRYASVPNLLAASASQDRLRLMTLSAAVAHAYQSAFRVDELNAVVCGGRVGVSNSVASALWVLDTLFQLASAGVDGVNIHTWPGAPASQPFTFQQADGHWLSSVRPEYYGMLGFTKVAPPGSRFLQVKTASRAEVRPWATLGADGRIRIALLNSSPTHSHTVLVHPPLAAGPARLEWLRGPSAYATGGVTFAGQRFGPTTTTGAMKGKVRRTLLPKASEYRLKLPASSVAILTIPDRS